MKKNSYPETLNVIFTGGLGNQLFIYCAAKNIAFKEKIKNIFFYPSHGILKQVKDISFYINEIKIEKTIANKYLSSLFIFFKCIISSSIITDNNGKYKNCKKITLQGYFQDPKWYKSVLKGVIFEIFSKNLIKELKKINLHDVVISFRRKDYIQLGMCLSESYYINSIKKLKIKKKEKIKIVSDDESFALKFEKLLKKKGYKFYGNKRYVKNKSFNDFLVLIKSKKLIMSNSSFCWWASVCRSKLKLESKNVICPKQWFPGNRNLIRHLKMVHPGNPFKWKFVDSQFIL